MVDVRAWASWPIGALMLYDSPSHRGLGVVVGNDTDCITVVWGANCGGRMLVYLVSQLNVNVIRRLV